MPVRLRFENHMDPVPLPGASGHCDRHGLPVRGQRTRTNARTRKGKRKTIANKKQATK